MDYCRDIEAYLCQKNDGHLIRIAGPAFGLVSAWEAQGVPIKIAFAGIDRCVERYYRKGPRRRPVRIEFCEADVLDAFDEWRRALGLSGPAAAAADAPEAPERSSSSLPAHLERVVTRLSSARAMGKVGASFDAVIDRIAAELDVARASARGVRGEARLALIARLSEIDGELLQTARASLDADMRESLHGEADTELAGYRDRMAPGAFARIREAAVDRLLRERLGLPTVAF